MVRQEHGLPSMEPMFGRHETFAPRYGWFKKTADGVTANPEIFSSEDATLRLGVGKNMVRSMRFWAGATRLVLPRRPERREKLRLTPLSSALLSEGGWDPYLELPASLWLLHWRLFGPGCQLPVWWYAFNDLAQPDFTVAGLTKLAMDAVSLVYGFREPAENSIKRDAECLIHTYARRSDGKIAADDAFACPFRGLGLIDQEPDRTGSYRFRVGPKPSLPAEIVAAAAAEFASRQVRAAQSVGLSRLLRDQGSPGKIFKLDEDSLISALSQVSRSRKDFVFTDTAGVSALQLAGDPSSLAVDLLNVYFNRVSGSSARLTTLRDDNDLLSLADLDSGRPSRVRRKARGSHD